MDKILIISNVRSQELGDFIKKRGAFEVAGCYNSINDNLLDIQNKILDVSKTLYLYQPEEGPTNIRADMQALQGMLSSNSFFRPGEISFITRTTPECKQAEKYFITVMKACGYTNYTIKNVEDSISFTNIYNSIMGISLNEDFQNTYKAYYRAERGVTSKVEYTQENDQDLVLEPFSMEELRGQKEQEKLVSRMISSVEFRDSEINSVLFDNPNLGEVKLDNILETAQVVLLSGKSKSGVSTWSSALAASASKTGNNTLILDYTSNADTIVHLEKGGVTYSLVKFKEYLEGTCVPSSLDVCTPTNDVEDSIKFNFMQYVFSVGINMYKTIIIAADYRDFERIYRLATGEISKVILTTIPRYSDVTELLDFLSITQDCEKIIIMNDIIDLDDDDVMSQQEIKETLSVMDVSVVGSVHFDTVNVGTNIYQGILKR